MDKPHRHRFAYSVCFPGLLGLAGSYLCMRGFTSYGWTLFFVMPALVSFLSALIYRKLGNGTWPQCYGISLLAIGVTCLSILLFALDGLICILMAFPLFMFIAVPASLFGYLVGFELSDKTINHLPILLIIVFPALVAFEGQPQPGPNLHEVTTRVEIDAPIEQVWQQVIAFDRITEPPSGIFRFGIAYPIEAKIEGAGVGAVRHCIFSTGPFVEPITTWDAPHRLAFDVASNPIPMQEFSPWGSIDVPHLKGTFVSEKGQFLLTETDGKTVLEGTTWYRQSLHPSWYWYPMADTILHRIHRRVLNHIKIQTEQNNL